METDRTNDRNSAASTAGNGTRCDMSAIEPTLPPTANRRSQHRLHPNGAAGRSGGDRRPHHRTRRRRRSRRLSSHETEVPREGEDITGLSPVCNDARSCMDLKAYGEERAMGGELRSQVQRVLALGDRTIAQPTGAFPYIIRNART